MALHKVRRRVKCSNSLEITLQYDPDADGLRRVCGGENPRCRPLRLLLWQRAPHDVWRSISMKLVAFGVSESTNSVGPHRRRPDSIGMVAVRATIGRGAEKHIGSGVCSLARHPLRGSFLVGSSTALLLLLLANS